MDQPEVNVLKKKLSAGCNSDLHLLSNLINNTLCPLGLNDAHNMKSYKRNSKKEI